jgi:very-short-patch-repair endonuclease
MLTSCLDDGEVVVEIDGVHHPLADALDTSQGPILIVDTDQEEREMR